MSNLPTVPSENEFQTMISLSRSAAASGLYNGIGNESKILMILLAARELGIGPMIALNGGIWNIQGKIEISARLMNSMIRRAGHSIVVKQCDASKCVIEGRRYDNGDTFSAQFTIEDATKAGLTSRSNWKAYAEDMLYARAMSRLARRLFPDVIGSAYVEGEIRDSLREPKCEVIENVICEEVDLSPEETEKKILEFLESYPQEDHEMIRSYLLKYSSYWKKSMKLVLEHYKNKEVFESDFNKWKKKEIEKSSKNNKY